MKLRTAGGRLKKKKQFNKTTGIVDTSLIISSAIIGGTSTSTFGSVVGLPVDTALGGLGVVLSLSTIVRRKISKTLTVKQ